MFMMYWSLYVIRIFFFYSILIKAIAVVCKYIYINSKTVGAHHKGFRSKTDSVGGMKQCHERMFYLRSW